MRFLVQRMLKAEQLGLFVEKDVTVHGHIRQTEHGLQAVREHTRTVETRIDDGPTPTDRIKAQQYGNPDAPSLTVFRMGLGRDSIAMMCLLVEQGILVGGERIHPKDVDAVVFTDTGAEWTNTYALIPRVAKFCEDHGLRFIVLAKPGSDGEKGWKRWLNIRKIGSRDVAPWRDQHGEDETIESKAARGFYATRAPIMADYASRGAVVKFNDASCTVNHKIGPNRGLINDLSVAKYGLDNRHWSLAVARGDRPPHRVLLGIAADEAERAEAGTDAADPRGPAYEHNYYPLIEMGVTKPDEVEILKRHGFDDTKKSGCVMCKFQPIEWYWALRETDPERFAEVVKYEQNALKTSPNLLLFPKGVPASNGWNGDTRPGKERPRLPIAEAVELWHQLNKDRNPTAEQVLAKTYKRCETAPTKDAA